MCIRDRSELGKGSTFTLFLPERYLGARVEGEDAFGAIDWTPTTAGEPAGPGSTSLADIDGETRAALAGRRVLVVDDDVRSAFALSSVLEAAGLDVVYADNGQTGIDMLTADPTIDVVLMDVMMPGKDGYETIRAIRADPDLRDRPVIAVTAKALDDDRGKCFEAGASDYVPKPVDAGKLLGLILRWISPKAGPGAAGETGGTTGTRARPA